MSLEEALNIITKGDVVTLTCVYSQGKRQGQIYNKVCRYGATDGHERFQRVPGAITTEGGRQIGSFVESGTLPMAAKNELTGRFTEFFSPQLYHIMMVDGKKIFK